MTWGQGTELRPRMTDVAPNCAPFWCKDPRAIPRRGPPGESRGLLLARPREQAGKQILQLRLSCQMPPFKRP